MVRNVIIVLFSSMIVSWCVYVYKNRKSLDDGTVRIGRKVFIVWLIMIGLPNIPVLIMPVTPTVHGRITNQPGSSCNIKAYWVVSQIGLAGGNTETYEQFSTKTDTDGNFTIPKRMKALSVLGLLPAFQIASGFGGTYILAYTPGYPHSSDWGAGPYSIMPIKLEMQIYPPGNEYLRSKMLDGLDLAFMSWNEPRGELTDEDKAYLLENSQYIFRHFDEIYNLAKPNDIETGFIRVGSNLIEYGDYKTAYEVYSRMKQQFPDDTTFADRELEQLSRRMQIKK